MSVNAYVTGFEVGLRQIVVKNVLENCVEVEPIYLAMEEAMHKGLYIVSFSSIVIKTK